MRKKIIYLFLTVFLLLGTFQAGFAAFAEGESTIITLYHSNDSHGRVVADEEIIGIDTIASIVKSTENALLVDAGDSFHGLPIATISQGKDMVGLMNAAGYSIMAPGNHDFNYGYKRLLELRDAADFDLLSANAMKGGGTLLDSHVIKQVQGIKIGFFGLTTPETAYMTNPKNIEDLSFRDPIQSAKEQVSALKAADVDLIVAIAHVGTDPLSAVTTEKIAAEVAGIDVIIDGHSHSAYENGLPSGNNTLIASTGEYEHNLGKVTFVVSESGRLVSKSAALISKEQCAAYEPDPTVKAKLDAIVAAQETLLAAKIGSTEAILDGEKASNRTGETNLGNLITDAMAADSGAAIAITNGGGIRATVQKGTITRGDMITVLPFGNFIVTKKLSGEQVRQILEHGVKDYPEASGGFPHVSGIHFVFDPAQKPGSRIVSITRNGAPLDMKASYLVATNDYLAAGGDGFSTYTQAKTENEFSTMEEAVTRFIKAKGSIRYAAQGRITTGTADGLAAKTVAQLIVQLPATVALRDSKAIQNARRAYDALTAKQKKLVTNVARLTQAEQQLAKLQNDYPETGESEAGAAAWATLFCCALVATLLLVKGGRKTSLSEEQAA